MSRNESAGRPKLTKGSDSYNYYQQLGAPTLIYEGSRANGFEFPISSQKLPKVKNKELHDKFKRRSRVRARWEYGLDVNQVETVVVPHLLQRGKNKDNPKARENEDTRIHSENLVGENDEEKGEASVETSWIDRKQQQNRLSLLLEDDTNISTHKDIIKNYTAFQHPYVEAELKSMDRKTIDTEPQIDTSIYSKGQEFSISRKIDSDPSYLAPFDLESINEATNEGGKKVQRDPPLRLPQGNTLLCINCPCGACTKGTQGYIVLHPKGQCMERLCVSSLVAPTDQENAGDVRNSNLRMMRKRRDFHWNTIASKPNEICLDDTILEIRQCGTWNVDNPRCIFAVRTGTHISVVEITCTRPDLKEQQRYTFPMSSCWGCYALEERERFDQRSFFPKLPSLLPVSLTSHPRYGNNLTPCKFAFASRSVRGSSSLSCNVVHTCTFGTERISLNRHDIMNLKNISFIDFSAKNPMCLWSAAASHVRPSLAPGAISKMSRQTKGPFGLGSSLFSIDLRSNSASFQWSPSAEEMTTEGVHSINGILTDWRRENTIFVTSSSAGKTYEIDGRMPCRAVNTWSLTSVCEESRNITLPSKAFYGEPSLLMKPLSRQNNTRFKDNDDSPLMKVNTDFRASGIHLFQKPIREPRFQTDSLECIGIAGLDTSGTASIATSSYYDLIDVADDTYTCGISSVRLPMNRFVGTIDDVWTHYLDHELDILCTLTINNKGDIYCHSFLESNNTVNASNNCHRFDGLPIGTTAINIPAKLDGRTKLLKNGHWKPTGGMNLSLFLSNTYPIPHDTRLSNSHQPAGSGGEKDRNTIYLDNRKKKRIDDSADIIHIPKSAHKVALTIADRDSKERRNDMILENGENGTLVMPLSLAENVQRTTMVYEGSDGHDSDDSSRSISVRAKKNRSDLSKNIIEDTLEGWEDTPSESDSS